MKRVFDYRWNLHLCDGVNSESNNNDNDESNNNSDNLTYICTNIFETSREIHDCRYSYNKTHLIIQEHSVLKIISLEQKSYHTHEFNPYTVLPFLSIAYIYSYALYKSDDILIIKFNNSSDPHVYIFYFDHAITNINSQVIAISRFKNDMNCSIDLNEDIGIISMVSDKNKKIQYRKIKTCSSIFRELPLSCTDSGRWKLDYDNTKTDLFQLICYGTNEITIVKIDLLLNRSRTMILQTTDDISCLTYKYYHGDDNGCCGGNRSDSGCCGKSDSPYHYIITIENDQIKHYRVKNIIDDMILQITPFHICNYTRSYKHILKKQLFENIKGKFYYIQVLTFIDGLSTIMIIDVYTGNIVYCNCHSNISSCFKYDTYYMWDNRTLRITEMTLVDTNATKIIYAKPNVICSNLSSDQSLFVNLLEG